LTLRRLFLVQSIFVVSLLGQAATSGEEKTNWPQFRGIQAAGVAESAPVPTTWDVSSGTNVRWQTPIPGLAHASPIVWNDAVYLATAVSPEKADLKVGLYGDIASANDRGAVQWRLISLDKKIGAIRWNTLGYEGIPA
jgi:hypothetical protein